MATPRLTGHGSAYGRTLAHVLPPDEGSLNQELVRQGYAWWFRKYSTDQTLAKLEAEARQNSRGLCTDPNPTPLWDWRDQQRTRAKEPLAEVRVVPNSAVIAALLFDPVGVDRGNETVEIGNRTPQAMDLAGWKLRDRAGNEYRLAGPVAARWRLRIVMTAATMPRNNDGDMVMLIDPAGVLQSRVEYTGEQVQ